MVPLTLNPLAMSEIETLKKQLAEAEAEIECLKLRLANVTVLFKKEMTASASLPKPTR
jgi:hypothetical protein